MSFINGFNVSLREPRREDLSLFKELRNEYDTAKYFRTVKPITDWNQDKYWEMIQEDNHIVFTILDNEKQIPIGEIRLSNISYQGGEFGIVSDPKYRNKGYMTEALQLFLQFIFGRANINRVEAMVAIHNIEAIEFFKKNGFFKEGVLRQKTYYDSEYQDVVMYSMLKEEFVVKNKDLYPQSWQ